ncbi:hypothetical protein ACQEV2_13675 [Streptomyces sp. CA-251387]|uniref:hypothetical protein n=1 Tax=Streptomyces sp. CA-251387 TaxID=3240064 RepID=UPI003D901C49
MDGQQGARGPAAGSLRMPPVVLKILITVAVGTVTYVISNLIAPSQEDLWQLALAVLTGGAVLIVQYLGDFEQRLGAVETGQRQHRHELTELVDRGFERVGEVTGLFSRLEQSGMNAEDVVRLARSAAQVGYEGPAIVRAVARAEIERLASSMAKLTSGSADWPGENNDLLIDLTQCARDSIDAISSFLDRAFWETEAAKYYLDLQRDAIRHRGVKVRRLFVVTEREEFDESLAAILEQHRDTGVEVGVVALSELPPRIRGGETLDVVIFDGEVYFEITRDVRQLNPSAKVEAREERVARRKARFDSLWDARLEDRPVLGGG